MAFSHGTAARVWINGLAASCDLSEYTQEMEVDTAEVTTLCDTAKQYTPGLEDGSLELSGFFDTDTVNPTETFEFQLDALKRTIFPVTFFPDGGGQIGDPAYMMEGMLTNYTVETSVDEAALLEMEWQSRTGLQRGIVVLEDGLRNSTGDNDPGVDNGALTSNGGIAVLSVSAANGTSPTLDVIIEHSVDAVAWATLATFSQVTDTDVPIAEYLTFSGTVNRHVRVAWTLGGTSPDFTFNVVMRRN